MTTLIQQIRDYKKKVAVASTKQEEADQADDLVQSAFKDIQITVGLTPAATNRLINNLLQDEEDPTLTTSPAQKKPKRRIVRKASKKASTKASAEVVEATGDTRDSERTTPKTAKTADLGGTIIDVAGNEIVGATQIQKRVSDKTGLNCTVPNVRYYLARAPFKKLGRGKFQNVNGSALT